MKLTTSHINTNKYNININNNKYCVERATVKWNIAVFSYWKSLVATRYYSFRWFFFLSIFRFCRKKVFFLVARNYGMEKCVEYALIFHIICSDIYFSAQLIVNINLCCQTYSKYIACFSVLLKHTHWYYDYYWLFRCLLEIVEMTFEFWFVFRFVYLLLACCIYEQNFFCSLLVIGDSKMFCGTWNRMMSEINANRVNWQYIKFGS